MDTETKKLLKTMERSNRYISVADLVKRFVEIDEIYGQTPWNLDQIIRNINMIIPLEIPEECIDLLTNPMWGDRYEK